MEVEGDNDEATTRERSLSVNKAHVRGREKSLSFKNLSREKERSPSSKGGSCLEPTIFQTISDLGTNISALFSSYFLFNVYF